MPGCVLTCIALYKASRSIRTGDQATTNRMFRARIYAQGFTLLCIVAGSFYYAEERGRRKQFEESVTERKARERNQAWIRELEARDREEKELEVKKAKARQTRCEDGGRNLNAERERERVTGIAKSTLERSEGRKRGSVLKGVRDLMGR